MSDESAGRLLNLRMDPDGGDPDICSAGTIGYSEETLLEKCARDSKIVDIFRRHSADPAIGGRSAAVGPVVV